MQDREVKELVEEELQYQPAIDSADIGVRVEAGIVHLDGYVPTYSQRYAVEGAVKRVKGVRGLVDDLEVRTAGEQYGDEAIARRVANLVEWDVMLPKDTIKVKVENGVVTLSGEVEWAYQRASAESGVRRLPGVRQLINAIQIKPQVHATDIRDRIEKALKRQADIEADRVLVTVEGGRVKLSGKVRAWYEREVIEKAAWSAPGVTAVEDHLTVAV
mgnify:CR=1 FL=1